jgi:hypothetical protein
VRIDVARVVITAIVPGARNTTATGV